MKKNKNEAGFVIIGVAVAMIVSLILLTGVIMWIQNESKWTVRYQKTTTAFHLAESAVDRAVWHLKKSTGTWQSAEDGDVLAGYDLDVAYNDIPGGTYRIKISSGPGNKQVTIIGEGRDKSTKEVRAVKAIYKNQVIQGSIISGGLITWSDKLAAHWGPVLAHGNIQITSNAAQKYSPRKFSRQVVECTNAGNPRDTNGLTPPNTDNMEWWSDYDVPDLPILNFTELVQSAANTGTHNVGVPYGCNYQTGSGKKAVYYYNAPWAVDGGSYMMCQDPAPHTNHFQDSNLHPDSKKNYVWYWDGDVTFTNGDPTPASNGRGNGIYGTVIVRGNMINNAPDNYSFTGDVPEEAWMEYSKITKTTGDTAAPNEYPADIGYQKNKATFNFGSENWSWTPAVSAARTDIGIRGFVYVGKNLYLNANSDFYGAVWVNGDIDTSSGGVGSEPPMVFFDANLEVPVLNVVLKKLSWQEVAPNASAWP